MLRTKLTAGALSAVLAVSLCPGLALAADLGTGTIADDADGSATVTTQEEKKSVWVINTIEDNGVVDTVGYNKNFLVKNYRNYSIKHSGKRLKMVTYEDELVKIKWKFKSYKNGGFNAAKAFWSDGSKTEYTFVRDGNGEVCKQVGVYKSKDFFGVRKANAKTIYTATHEWARDSKGLPYQDRTAVQYVDGSNSLSTLTKYKFSGKKALVKEKEGKYRASEYINRYHRGRLLQTVASGWMSANQKYGVAVYNYTYKKVKVPAKFVNTVKKEQWALQNKNLNCAFGPSDVQVGQNATLANTYVNGL